MYTSQNFTEMSLWLKRFIQFHENQMIDRHVLADCENPALATENICCANTSDGTLKINTVEAGVVNLPEISISGNFRKY